ncbi:hypothetical protein PVAP13_6KG237206 [Panicum virgatum]|uniref:Uncharacterized protein n=1 Tax=Panicum virgatum TaxID=38727 RepID=A0A8T0RCX6_PANVG|nr:hypothetical protein PVAP13_6KG237206 [Panicum virgatum]
MQKKQGLSRRLSAGHFAETSLLAQRDERAVVTGRDGIGAISKSKRQPALPVEAPRPTRCLSRGSGAPHPRAHPHQIDLPPPTAASSCRVELQKSEPPTGGNALRRTDLVSREVVPGGSDRWPNLQRQ